jgi:hypothetical protein
MGDKVDKYLDKVVDILVKGTMIDFNSREISYPFVSPPTSFFLSIPLPTPLSHLFSNYVRDNYGLTENEKDYVWNEYKKVIKNKIENGR